MIEAEARQRVIEVARTWVKTPYHHNAMLKGVGVDCAMIIIAVYREADVGVIPADPPGYLPQWFLHKTEERYLAEIAKYAHEVDIPKPGDVVVYRIGRTFSHGGIVIEWPERIIHALQDAGMVIEDRGDGGRLAGRERKFFSYW